MMVMNKVGLFGRHAILKEEYLAMEQCVSYIATKNVAKIWSSIVGKLQIQWEVEKAVSSLCLVSFSDDSPLGTEECNSCTERSPA